MIQLEQWKLMVRFMHAVMHHMNRPPNVNDLAVEWLVLERELGAELADIDDRLRDLAKGEEKILRDWEAAKAAKRAESST